jgi:hypothetical protein
LFETTTDSRIGRSADLRVTVAKTIVDDTVGPLRLTVTKGPPDERELCAFDLLPTVTKIRSGLYDKLLAFKERDPGLDESAEPEHAAAALELLRDQGTLLAGKLCDPEDLREFRGACASVLSPSRRRSAQPPLIDVSLPADVSVPFELLPLFDHEWPSQLKTRDDVQQAAASFPGFASVVRRLPNRVYPQRTLFDPLPLNVAFVLHDSLDGAKGEFAHLETLEGVEVEEVFPRQKLPDKDAAEILGRRMFHACGDSGEPGTDQILHFACHCDAVADNPDDWRLRIGADSSVYMDDLTIELTRAWDDGDPTPAPLVFLNACGSSTINSTAAISFVSTFEKTRTTGFIGTETKIPDDVAAAYAGAFYRLLLRGASLGDAAHGAKRELLDRFMNPLGILYTLYGNPDLRLAPETQPAG